MTAADFAFGWNEASAFVRRVGHEEGIDVAAYDLAERFARHLPDCEPDLVFKAFAIARASTGEKH